jgi:hypothetical protein
LSEYYPMSEKQGSRSPDAGTETSGQPSHLRGARRPDPPTRPPEWEPLRDAPEVFRNLHAGQIARAHRSPTEAIRLMCLDCCCYVSSEPAKCPVVTCALYAINRRLFVDQSRRNK